MKTKYITPEHFNLLRFNEKSVEKFFNYGFIKPVMIGGLVRYGTSDYDLEMLRVMSDAQDAIDL